ncbi:MAG: ATP-binding cassette domain-containing protein, partial [Lachnospiraceae bacterium]|nr:ATP-binding cassette domain-containing protein [Lachnospiraceae bacterium]
MNGNKNAPIFALNNIRKSFADVPVLENISLSVEQGNVVSIIGPSGSGKST